MADLPPLYQRLIDARDAFADFHSFKAPSATLGQSQALVDTVNALIDSFVAGLRRFSLVRSQDDAKAARVELENVLDAYILDLTEGVARFEEHTGDVGLAFYIDALEQAISGEIKRQSAEASRLFQRE